ncbi:MAG: hypothetical protein GEU78_03510 [Actinobacteria bacterium]|nr:hypothetical protein [Actinomycetota bacterium]
MVRSRLTIVLALLLVAGNLLAVTGPAWAGEHVFAQEVGEGEEDAQPQEEEQTGESEDEGGAGQEDPEAQTDPGEGEEAESETGPPWTYQMARAGVLMALLMLAAIGLLYWRLVIRRARGAA